MRLAFLSLLCLENAMPYGGRVEVSQEDKVWMLHGQADKLNVDEALWSILGTQDVPENLRPAQVQFALLPLVADDDGRRVTTDVSETHVKLRF